MFIQVNGIELHYAMDGRGAPCIVPAVMGSPFYERTFSHTLRKPLRFVFVEPRGSGRSGGEVATVTFETLTADIDALRQALDIERTLVLGQSVNGLIALAYARAYPAQTLGVVLIGTPPVMNWQQARDVFLAEHMMPERRRIWKGKQGQLTRDQLNELSPQEVAQVRSRANGPLYWYDPTFDDAPLFEGCAMNPLFFQRLVQVLRDEYDPKRWLREIICPVFIAQGAYDFIAPPTMWDEMVEHVPHATFRLFRYSAHYPHYEEQIAFDEELLQWFAHL